MRVLAEVRAQQLLGARGPRVGAVGGRVAVVGLRRSPRAPRGARRRGCRRRSPSPQGGYSAPSACRPRRTGEGPGHRRAQRAEEDRQRELVVARPRRSRRAAPRRRRTPAARRPGRAARRARRTSRRGRGRRSSARAACGRSRCGTGRRSRARSSATPSATVHQSIVRRLSVQRTKPRSVQVGEQQLARRAPS